MNDKKDKFYSDLNYYKKFTIDLFKEKLLQFELSKSGTLEITDKNITILFPHVIYNNSKGKYVANSEIIHYISYHKSSNSVNIHCISSKVLPIQNLNLETLYQIMFALFEDKKDLFELKQ